MSVARAQEEISSEEFIYWVAYDQIEPGDPFRSDARNALLCQVLASIWGSKKGKKPKLEDFMLDFEPKQKTASELEAKITAWLTPLSKG